MPFIHFLHFSHCIFALLMFDTGFLLAIVLNLTSNPIFSQFYPTSPMERER